MGPPAVVQSRRWRTAKQGRVLAAAAHARGEARPRRSAPGLGPRGGGRRPSSERSGLGPRGGGLRPRWLAPAAKRSFPSPERTEVGAVRRSMAWEGAEGGQIRTGMAREGWMASAQCCIFA